MAKPIVIHQTTAGIDAYLMIVGPVTIVAAFNGIQAVTARTIPTAWLFDQ